MQDELCPKIGAVSQTVVLDRKAPPRPIPFCPWRRDEDLCRDARRSPLFRPPPSLALINLLDPTPPFIDRQHLPIHLDALGAEYPLDLQCDPLEIVSGEREDRGACAGQADPEETWEGLIGQGREDFWKAGDLGNHQRGCARQATH